VSVSRLSFALSEAGVDIGVWAPDGSAMTIVPATGAVQYLAGPLEQVLRRFGVPDAIHDNGIWLPHNHAVAVIARRRRIPRVVSTRGMLEPWALKHKRLKKRLAWHLYQRADLRRAAVLHAATEVEKAGLDALDLGVPVTVIPNGVDLPDFSRAPRSRSEGPRVALFLGRIYPVKGLPMLIEAWSRVRPAGWRLRIAGPDEDGHRAEVAAQIAAFDLEDVVEFVGPVAASEKDRLFDAADLLIAPSHSESFGMSIAEALARGLPVLTTTAVPWPAIEEHRCGWRVEASVAGVARGLLESTATESGELAMMGDRGRHFIARQFEWERVSALFKSMYEMAAAVSP
jgi:glycosyltransferase involved in cell wall biosynthesis